MRRQKFPIIALEGVPIVFSTIVVGFLLFRYVDPLSVLPMLVILGGLVFLFRDPGRQIPAAPLGVVSPVDGFLESVREAQTADERHLLVFRIDSFGAYLARSPIEGKIMGPHAVSELGSIDPGALLLQTDEGDNVFLNFSGFRLGLVPKVLKSRGERFGQGQRCAYLRLSKRAELSLPFDAQLLIDTNENVIAGETLLAKLPRP